jgi:transposase, IS5 family
VKPILMRQPIRPDFGLKAHIGVTAKRARYMRSARRRPAHMLPDLLHREERKVWGGGYQGQTEAIR